MPGSITRAAVRAPPDGLAQPAGTLLDQAAAKRLGDRRGAVGCAELLEDVLEVRLDGIGGDVQAFGDVPVRVTEREELQHFDLSSRQGLGLPVALLRGGELFG